jgi:hypothetical protein
VGGCGDADGGGVRSHPGVQAAQASSGLRHRRKSPDRKNYAYVPNTPTGLWATACTHHRPIGGGSLPPFPKRTFVLVVGPGVDSVPDLFTAGGRSSAAPTVAVGFCAEKRHYADDKSVGLKP